MAERISMGARSAKGGTNRRGNPQATGGSLKCEDDFSSSTLRFCRRGLRLCSWRCRRVGSSEIHLGNLPGAFFRLEVSVVTREAAEARHQAVREKRDKRVVILTRLVVAAALPGDAGFRAPQPALQTRKNLCWF